MKKQQLSVFTKILLLISGLLLLGAIFFPMWRIELSAPQYPEGLVLQLHANKIAGDVDVINGLNHYIGMKTLHTEDFIEFKILPYILGFFGIFTLSVIFINKRKWLTIVFFSFVIFGITAAIDFYRWNYEYGHNLDPNAAIRVPGMSYQPPLLGYKQLLNFGAFSIPDIGGWMLILAGTLLFTAIIYERKMWKKVKDNSQKIAVVMVLGILFSCASDGPIPIKLNVDNCDYCKMGIADGKHGAEIITKKGRDYKFDDISCMVHYCKENASVEIKAYYVHDYAKENELIAVENAHFISGGSIKTPMHGKVIGFSSEAESQKFAKEFEATTISWSDILNK